MELKEVKNIIFINFARNYARVKVEDNIKQIRFKVLKVDNKIVFRITKGEEYCQI